MHRKYTIVFFIFQYFQNFPAFHEDVQQTFIVTKCNNEFVFLNNGYDSIQRISDFML